VTAAIEKVAFPINVSRRAAVITMNNMFARWQATWLRAKKTRRGRQFHPLLIQHSKINTQRRGARHELVRQSHEVICVGRLRKPLLSFTPYFKTEVKRNDGE
jgi:hypothetical protein